MKLIASILPSFVILLSCGIHPDHLTCENLSDPCAIDSGSPALGWVCRPGTLAKGQIQTAYRICAASSKDRLERGEYDLWDSGKLQSEESAYIPYCGTLPSEGSECFWKVMVWDKRGHRSPWSKASVWRRGMDDVKFFDGNWIGAGWQHGAAPEFEKEINIVKPVVQAVVFVSALGFYELSINGGKVGEDFFSPNISNATKRPALRNGSIAIDDNCSDYRVYYLTYDVTDMLKSGSNRMNALLGEGFYNSKSHWTCPFGENALFCRLLVRYSDGTEDEIITDTSWKVRESAIRWNGVYTGELLDASFEPGEWTSAVLKDAPDGKLRAQTMHGDRIIATLSPVSLTRCTDGKYLVDFGREITGWIRFNGIEGNKGDTLKVDYICESKQGVQRYVFSGNGRESCAPKFTWFAFSKAEISGVDNLKPENLTAEFISSDVRENSVFECSDPLYNQINDIWRQSQKDNMHTGVASDCPHRERSPYTGDGQVSCVTVMHNFDAAAFYRKWIRDILDSQNPESGYVPNSAPWQPSSGGGVPWGAAINIMPWEFYLHYGDRRMIEECYPGMKSHLEWMCGWITPDGTMLSEAKTLRTPFNDKWLNLGDWAPAFSLPNKEAVHTFFLWRCADYTSKAAIVLGKVDEAERFRILADETAAAYDRKFYDSETHSYGDFGANVFALTMGIPDEKRDLVVEALRQEIEDRHDSHLDTGIFGTQYLFETLARYGLNDLACKVMSQKDFPSYGNWIEQGATTTWEQWNGKDSHNHPMFGGGLTWFYRDLAGLRADPLVPAYKHMIVKPVLSGLEHVSYTLETVYGTAATEISQKGGRHILKVTVPVSCTATVHLPWNGEIEDISQGTYVFRE